MQNDATALRLRIILFPVSQRSRGGNVGLVGTAPLGHPQKPILYQSAEFSHSLYLARFCTVWQRFDVPSPCSS